MGFGVIYTISDPTNNMIRYVGQTIDLKARIRKHISTSTNKKTYCQCWINSLLLNNIKPCFDVIETIDVESLDFELVLAAN